MANDHNTHPTNVAGEPREPYGSEFQWENAETLSFTSADGLVTCRVFREGGRDYTFEVSSRGWASAKDAKEVFHMIALVLLDEHGYCLRYDEFDYSILNRIGAGRLRYHGVHASQLLQEARELGVEPHELDEFEEEFQQSVAEHDDDDYADEDEDDE